MRRTVLHPRHKLQYFREANWEEGWIATAREIIHDEFKRAYATLPVNNEEPVRQNKKVCNVPSYPPTMSKLTTLPSRSQSQKNAISSMIYHHSRTQPLRESQMSSKHTLTFLLKM
jgi:hypothetical protein